MRMPLLDATRNYLNGATSAVEVGLSDLAPWAPPVVKGQPIWEHLPRIAQLRRGRELRAALALAEESLAAMRDAALADPSSVFELYVCLLYTSDAADE